MNEDPLLPPLPDKAADLKSRPSRARYDKVKSTLDVKWRRRAPQGERMMRELIDTLWDHFGDDPWTWCGVWLPQPDGKAFQPGQARPSPAPGAVAREGLLGDCYSGNAPKSAPIVDGEGARLFVPVQDKNGKAWAVFEARSKAAFDDMDTRWLERLLKVFQTIDRPEAPL